VHLAPHPMYFTPYGESREKTIKAHGILQGIKWDNEKKLASVFVIPVYDFGSGGPPQDRISFFGGGDEEPPFEIGDTVYLLPRMDLGMGVVQDIKKVQSGWMVRADFSVEGHWVTYGAKSDKFRRAYGEEQ